MTANLDELRSLSKTIVYLAVEALRARPDQWGVVLQNAESGLDSLLVAAFTRGAEAIQPSATLEGFTQGFAVGQEAAFETFADALATNGSTSLAYDAGYDDGFADGIADDDNEVIDDDVVVIDIDLSDLIGLGESLGLPMVADEPFSDYLADLGKLHEPVEKHDSNAALDEYLSSINYVDPFARFAVEE